ncbi:hypothetical protein JCM11641_004984 [Rhodosporidiobolus odoratus]
MSGSATRYARVKEEDEVDEATRPLGIFKLLTLSAGLGATQLCWSVQNAYGTPYMNSLGIPAQYTALIWLASPFAGAIVQPTIGPLSDETPGHFRRRSWLIGSTILTLIALFYTSYAPEFAYAFSVPDASAKGTTLAIAIVSLWTANFALNGMQATVRDLVLDQAPAHQQPLANAWGTRFADMIAVLGYFAGYFRLSTWRALDWMGTGKNLQFRKLAFVSSVGSSALVVLVCVTQRERENRGIEGGGKGRMREVWGDVKKSVTELPVAVWRVCYVQVLAWCGYNCVLIYSTTYVSSIVYSTHPAGTDPPSSDEATRYGSFALVLYSLVALGSSIVVPLICGIGSRPFVLRHSPRWIKRVLCVFTPRTMWTLGLLVFAVAMGSTFAVKSVGEAQAVIAVVGVSWAIGEWVPYALVLETVRELDQQPTSTSSSKPSSKPSPVPTIPIPAASSTTHSSPGGSFLGIHASSIVIAKIIMSSLASLIFKLYATQSGEETTSVGKGGAVWVLRFGGVMCVLAALASRWTLESSSEKVYKERLLRA